ncbi:MAG: hypothetical protein IRY99_00045 [Isosphaeraceae bacterium]|nr:hypothetical protein [Isosphaeraceae bacterium]
MNPDARNGSPGLTALASLRRFVQPRAIRERCELCSAELTANHSHLVELSRRRLVCACEPCAILFDNQVGTRYRRVPRRVQFLPDFRLSDLLWEGLQLPINLAFFLQTTPAGHVVALYPSPAGATESLIAAEAWEALVEENPVLRSLEPDVEGLLVNRVTTVSECYRIGIDECYRLVGLIRTHWRGLSGGTVVWEEIGRFFTGLRERSS